MILRRFAWAGLLLAATAGAAQAKGYIITLGARVATAPPYEGSDVYVFRPFPTLSLRPASSPYRFSPPDGGTTFTLIDTQHFEFGPMARFRYKRKSTGDLTGFRELKWAAEPGAFVNIWPTNWLRLRGEARHGVAGHHGFVGDTGIDLVYTGKKWDASLGGRAGWGDSKYLNEYFGVTAQDAARSPLINRTYMPGGGRRYAGLEFAAAYNLDRHWQIKGDIGYRRLAEKAGDSPIIAIAGSRDQYLSSLGISYSFGVGTR
jgi:outer membrane protein